MDGQMIWFDEEKGFGYIQTDAGERLYVAAAGFAGGVHPVGRCAGKRVRFDRDDAGGGCEVAHAVNAEVLAPVQPRRARLRHRAGR